MNLVWFLLRESWKNVVLAAIAGLISGFCNAFLIALVNQSLNSNNLAINSSVWQYSSLALLALITSFLSQFLLIRLSQTAVYKLRLSLSSQVLACPLRHLEDLGSAKLLATLSDDIQAISLAVFNLPFLCTNLALTLGCLIYLGSLSLQVFAIVLILLTTSIAIVQILLTKGSRLIQLARDEQDRLYKNFQAIINGNKELKLNNSRRQVFFNDELTTNATRSKDFRVQGLSIFVFATSFGEFFFFFILGFFLFVVPSLTQAKSTVIASYILTLTYLIRPLQSILQTLPTWSQVNIALRKIEALGLSLQKRSEDMDYNNNNNTSLLTDKIEFQNITHIYRQENQESNFKIGEIDLTIRAGELVFIVGGNGSGKSTLAKVIAGLYIPETGNIFWDGREINDNNRSQYRQLFSTVFADFYLFEKLFGISLENLDERAQEYLIQLQIEHKVKVKEGLLSTIDLSQGQRKRLALLTAYLEDRSIYLFDEWASDQDPYFREIFYKQILGELKQRGKTVLVISHDDRYFHLADRLIKLDYGKIVNY
jgi:putative pyoverdin transport system ATP-binding/permease protein